MKGKADSSIHSQQLQQRESRWFPKLIALLTALFASLLATGCNQSNNAAAPQGPPPPAVTVAAVQSEQVMEWDEFVGRTEALETVEIRPRVSGHLQEVRFQAGQMVKAGDVLFVIDQRWHQAEFERAKAEFERAKVRAEIAEREHSRAKQLLGTKAISIEEADARNARLGEAQAALMAAKAAMASAQLDLEFTEVKAPISGRISRALLTPGNYVSGVAGFTTVLATVVTIDPIYVYSDVDEATLLKFNRLVEEKQLAKSSDGKIAVEMQLGDEGGFNIRGHIESFDNRVEAATGSILLRTIFPNPDGRIVPGLFARVRVPGSGKYEAVVIDEKAIGTDQSQKFVLTLTSSNTVAYRPVKLGRAINGKRIVKEGLKTGETIVVNGIARVRPGMPVVPQTATNTAEKAVAAALQ
ncbi:MAG: efflux RND transporter periplasmic adaptor subunit [Verrucomicrobiota bacterium]|nr:efflux RND transporter periplasmic adaptor subunit [Verrucomicrobiota bacterium]